MLQKYHPLWMSVHVNHPRELTIEVKQALERLANVEQLRFVNQSREQPLAHEPRRAGDGNRNHVHRLAA